MSAGVAQGLVIGLAAAGFVMGVASLIGWA
jgi:hypothetical protein